MSETEHPIVELLRRDKRYRRGAYQFVFDALSFAQDKLGMGSPAPSAAADDEDDDGDQESDEAQRHVTGQQLCEAMRIYAHQEYGYLAKQVLNHWGIRQTGDFGEIVFNLIEVGLMRKTPDDRREDFNDVFDFDEGFQRSFQITSASDGEE